MSDFIIYITLDYKLVCSNIRVVIIVSVLMGNGQCGVNYMDDWMIRCDKK